MFQRWHVQARKDVPPNNHPCAWKALTGQCREAASGNCSRCAGGASPDADIVAAIKSAATQRMAAKFV